MQLNFIPIDQIRPNPAQPRRRFDEKALHELAHSIRTHGLIHAVVVEPAAEGGYQLIDGERRWRAAQLAGLAQIRAEVRLSPAGQADIDRAVLALVANLQRADLTPVEEGRAYQQLRAMGLSVAEIAHRLAVNRSRIEHRLAILALDGEIQDLIADGLLPIDRRVVTALQRITDRTARILLAQKIARPGLSIKRVEAAVDKFLAAQAAQRFDAAEVPALRIGAPELKRPEWDALAQLGQLPPWAAVQAAAEATCETCPLRPEASRVTCTGCAAVVLIAQMIRRANHDG